MKSGVSSHTQWDVDRDVTTNEYGCTAMRRHAVDTVFFQHSMSGVEVRRSLIDDDGYPSDIILSRRVFGRTIEVLADRDDEADELIRIEGEDYWRDEMSEEEIEEHEDLPDWLKEH